MKLKKPTLKGLHNGAPIKNKYIMENNQETTSILNDLVQINNDRIKGYEKAITETEGDEQLKDIFTRMIGQSHQFKMELGTEIQAAGSDIDNDTSGSGALHRTWILIKETFTGHSEKSTLEECEFGEDAIKKAYSSALEEENLPAFVRELLNKQYETLLDAHNEIKALRDSVKD
jgi:uncharacterized protein (TIGR02284 family)